MSEQSQCSYASPGRYRAPQFVEVNPRQAAQPTPQGVQTPPSAEKHFEDVWCPLTRLKCQHEDCAWFKCWVTSQGTFGMCAVIDLSKNLYRLSATLDRANRPQFG